MSWYRHSMPTISEVSQYVDEICREIRAIDGVKSVYLWGSYVEHKDQPNYAIKDIDIIAATSFDVGDLLAIDNTRTSALRINPLDLEDEGFNPVSVNFTKKFISYAKYNTDHWSVASNGSLVHWGAMPETREEWSILHAESEQRANETCNVNRDKLYKCDSDKKREWRQIYESHIANFLSKKASGWCLSDHKFAEIKETVRKVC